MTQTSLADLLRQRRDKFISDWTEWRDAQALDDEARDLIDKVYLEWISVYDNSIGTLVGNQSDDVPF